MSPETGRNGTTPNSPSPAPGLQPPGYRKSRGFMNVPLTLTAQCKWQPVEWPVVFSVPIIWPVDTYAPATMPEMALAVMWAYQVTRLEEWAMITIQALGGAS